MIHLIHRDNNTLLLCNENELNRSDHNSVVVFANTREQRAEAFEAFKSHCCTSDITICTDCVEEALKEFSSGFQIVNAGGGIILSEKGEFLLIRRNGKWDLPKGKQEEGEQIEQTAIREVCEECGIKPEEIVLDKFICKTSHIYNTYGPENLKETFWYLMKTASDIELKPQTEEGISQLVWVKKEDISAYLSETYPSISEVFRNLTKICNI